MVLRLLRLDGCSVALSAALRVASPVSVVNSPLDRLTTQAVENFQWPTCQTLIALIGLISINISRSRLSLIQISNSASVAMKSTNERHHPSLRAIINPMAQHMTSPKEFM